MGKNKTVGKYEVHRHSYVSGPNAMWSGRELVHSHEGGDRPHEHEHTGPASRTIDKDEWFAATGLIGGGRKKFTKKPSGEQLAMIEIEPPTFDVIFVGSDVDTADGAYVPERLRLAFGARANVRSRRRAA